MKKSEEKLQGFIGRILGGIKTEVIE